MARLLMMLEKMNGGAEEIHWRIYSVEGRENERKCDTFSRLD